MNDDAPRVFISYAHDTVEHKERILRLADKLRGDGVEAWIDQYRENEPGDWPRWMREQITKADFVLCVASPLYLKRVEGEEEPGKGRGAKWEGAIIQNALYEAEGRDKKFIPIAFSRADADNFTPLILRGPTHYVLEDDRVYENLYRRLTNQPRIQAPPLGAIRKLPTESLPPASAPATMKSGPVRTPEAEAVFTAAQSGKRDNLAKKLGMLGQTEQRYVLTRLLQHAATPWSVRAVAAIAKDPPSGLRLEDLATKSMRSIYLSGDVGLMADLLNTWPEPLIAMADVKVREAFFEEVISTMEADQYEDVNRITPAVVRIHAVIPSSLHAAYVKALVSQGGSGAFQGKPAALAALTQLPEDLAKAGLAALDSNTLVWGADAPYRALIANHVALWPDERKNLFSEFVQLTPEQFFNKHFESQK